jgi:hypothetical protein
MFCYSNNGLSFRAVDSDYVAQTGEILFNVMNSTDVTEVQLLAAFPGRATAIKAQKIAELGATYQTKYNNLALQYGKIDFSDGDTIETKRAAAKVIYKNYMAAYNIEKAAIING